MMAAAALRIAGNPDRQGARIWGQFAFGELQEGKIDPIEGTVRDMILIGDQLHGYDMARHPLSDLRPGDYYTGDAVIRNLIIPIQAGNRRRRSTEDITARRIESNDTGEDLLCECCRSKRLRKVIDKVKRNL